MGNETAKAVVAALFTVFAATLGALGINYDATILQNVLSAAVFLAATVFGVWKNFNFTRAAQEGQKVTDAVKRGELDIEEV